ncbi:MAG: hypothetical protein AVDCRST_MAG40-2432, partial [uncultured Gemmatimonadaceae bacterium]
AGARAVTSGGWGGGRRGSAARRVPDGARRRGPAGVGDPGAAGRPRTLGHGRGAARRVHAGGRGPALGAAVQRRRRGRPPRRAPRRAAADARPRGARPAHRARGAEAARARRAVRALDPRAPAARVRAAPRHPPLRQHDLDVAPRRGARLEAPAVLVPRARAPRPGVRGKKGAVVRAYVAPPERTRVICLDELGPLAV